jgi:dihydrodipicolinate synthase/N-acetylneuraminate lyase
VEGIFVLGTTGEGMHVPPALRRRLVERTVQKAKGRALDYAGLGDLKSTDFASANEYFQAGASAVVAHPPVSVPVPVAELAGWYRSLLDALAGPLILYNMPTITRVSIPLDAIEALMGHPKFAGIKDSENDPKRLEELLKRFGGRPGCSIEGDESTTCSWPHDGRSGGYRTRALPARTARTRRARTMHPGPVRRCRNHRTRPGFLIILVLALLFDNEWPLKGENKNEGAG